MAIMRIIAIRGATLAIKPGVCVLFILQAFGI
jgi:hypothetical protein